MKNSILKIILLSLVLSFYNQACAENQKQSADELFNSAVATLKDVGGIGAFDSRDRRAGFPVSSTKNLSDSQRKEMIQSAISKLEQVIKMDPSIDEAYHYLGVAFVLNSQQLDAIKYFEKAIGVDKPKESSFIFLISLYWKTKKLDAANVSSERFLKEFPDKRITGLQLLGNTNFQQENYLETIKIGNEIVNIRKNDITGHFLLANSYFLIGDIESAEKHYNIILNIDPRMKAQIKKAKEMVAKKSANP
jgi:tetratricopeptide (TPR) repeat protein